MNIQIIHENTTVNEKQKRQFSNFNEIILSSYYLYIALCCLKAMEKYQIFQQYHTVVSTFKRRNINFESFKKGGPEK